VIKSQFALFTLINIKKKGGIKKLYMIIFFIIFFSLFYIKFNNMTKSERFFKILTNLFSYSENVWHETKREKDIETIILKSDPDLIVSGEIMNKFFESKRKLFVNARLNLKQKVVKGLNSEFTLLDLKEFFPNIDLNKIYFFPQPFGSQNSPDFLYISVKGFLSHEDKKNKKELIKWNTGWYGFNRLISFYNSTAQKNYLFTSLEYGDDNQNLYDELVRINLEQHEIDERRNISLSKIKSGKRVRFRMDFQDDSKPCDLFDPEYKNVIKLINELTDF